MMSDKVKSGKEVVDEFFAEILDVEGVDEKTVKKLVSLHDEKKFTDTNIQNAMDELIQEELDKTEAKNAKD